MKSSTIICLVVVALGGCRSPKRDAPEPQPAASVSATPTPKDVAKPAPKPFVPSHPVPAFTGKFAHVDEPMAATDGRIVEIAFARNGGEGDVAPLFTLKNLTDKPVRVGQTWIHYYDAAGKDTSYPSSFSGSLALAPHETKEQRIGKSIKDLPEGTTTIEGEMTSGSLDGTSWQNENLGSNRRPRGGYSPADLVEHAGERVIVDVYDLRSYKVRLTNVTDRPVKEVRVELHYADAKGQNRKQVSTQSEDLPLAPGASRDIVLKPGSDSNKTPPPKAARVVAFAHTVAFADGTKFSNENLREDILWQALKP